MSNVFSAASHRHAQLSTERPAANSQSVHSYPHLVVHYGELALKGKNRSFFEDRLIRNLRGWCHSIGPCTIRKLPGRIWLAFAEPVAWDRLSAIAAHCFGVANAHGMRRADPDQAALEALALDCASRSTFRTFAIRCRRGEKGFPLTSQEICVRIGRRIEEQTGARVDLTHPEWTVWIEILDQHCFVGCHRVEGPGGLPVGVSGKVGVLLSGGIDSPVAAWRMIRRGCEAIALHFHSAPFTSAASQEKVADLARCLAAWQGPIRLAMIPFGTIQQAIVTKAPAEYRIILYRRLMVRIAEALARAEGCAALVTGESLGQVASQTLSNIGTIDAVAAMPILRPLIGVDKREIVDEAKQIGTYLLSIEPHDDCCDFLGPRNPATRTSAAALDRIESGFDIRALVTQAVALTTWSNQLK